MFDAGDQGKEWPDPLPLIPERAARTPYPVDALGPILADAARAIVDATQCPVEIAAQSVLSVATLATQPHADVLTPAGQRRPLSLYFFTVAGSGERKTAADTLALVPVRKAEARAEEAYRAALPLYRNALDAWEAQRRAILGKRGSDYRARRDGLNELGSAPVAPLRPEWTVADVTIEGMVKGFVDARPSRGLFMSEGGIFAAGVAMNDDNRLKTAATLSALWDDGRVDRHRAGDGALSLTGRRLAVHVLIQPDMSLRILAARDLTDQGLISRILVAAPASNAGTRMFRKPDRDDPRLAAYNAAIGRLLEMEVRTCDGRNQADPRALNLDAKAEAVWIGFHDHIESQLGPDGRLVAVKPLGSKLAEHALRIAGVLTMVADPKARTIGIAAMERGCDLAEFYVEEALRLNSEARVSEGLARAEVVRRWLLDRWSEPLVSVADALQYGPNALRTKDVMAPALAILADHHWLRAIGAGVVAGAHRKACWAINRGPA